MALFGLQEISKILNAPVRLESMLASVVSILTSFLAMRRGMIVVINRRTLLEDDRRELGSIDPLGIQGRKAIKQAAVHGS